MLVNVVFRKILIYLITSGSFLEESLMHNETHNHNNRGVSASGYFSSARIGLSFHTNSFIRLRCGLIKQFICEN